MKYTTIIYDLDGTLLDTLDDLADSVNYALAAFNFPLRTREEVRQFVGNGLRRLMILAVPDGEANPIFEEVCKCQREYYYTHSNVKTKPYAGIMELLEKLDKEGYKQAIVSNKPDKAVKDLNDIYFEKYIFPAVGEQNGVRRKPAPDTVNKVMETLQVSREECLYVGDSEVDIETAANAGIDCASVSWGFRDSQLLREKGASDISDTTEELYRYIHSQKETNER